MSESAYLLLEIQPYGPKDGNNRVLGPNYYTINGSWALNPYSLGPWTLGVQQTEQEILELLVGSDSHNPSHTEAVPAKGNRRYAV